MRTTSRAPGDVVVVHKQAPDGSYVWCVSVPALDGKPVDILLADFKDVERVYETLGKELHVWNEYREAPMRQFAPRWAKRLYKIEKCSCGGGNWVLREYYETEHRWKPHPCKLCSHFRTRAQARRAKAIEEAVLESAKAVEEAILES